MKKLASLFSRGSVLQCIGIIVLAAGASLLASIWPVRLGELYTGISNGKLSMLSAGFSAILAFGVMYAGAELLSIARRLWLDNLITAVEADLRARSVAKLLRMPVSYFAGAPGGERTARLNQGVTGLSELLRLGCNDVVPTALTAAATTAQVFMNAPVWIALLMLAYIGVSISISRIQIQSQNGVREGIIARRTALDGQICQTITSIEMIRSQNAEECESARLEPGIEAIRKTEQHHHNFMCAFEGVKQLLKVGFQTAILILSVYLISRGQMAPGSVITVCLLFQQLVKPVDDVYRFLDDISSGIIKARILLELFESPDDPVFAIEGSPKEQGDGNIVLSGVEVYNPEGTKMLARFDGLEIPCRGRTALTGPSGSGKTTLVRALTRFYHSRGEISLCGVPLAEYSQRELAQQIYYAPQGMFFFSGSIRENILYGLKRPVDDTELLDALVKARLIGPDSGAISTEASPELLDRLLNEGATNVSAGQRQRLSLARAFLRRPLLFILDESTANLDSATVGDVLDALEAHAAEVGAGILYISHDQNVVARCDTVLRAAAPPERLQAA